MNILNTLLGLPRLQKRVIQVLIDCLVIALCFVLAMWLRLDTWSFISDSETWYVLAWVIPVTLAVFVRTGFYRAVLRYIGLQAAYTVALGIFASAVTMFVVSQVFDWFVPRSVPLIYTLLAIVTIGGVRLVWRTIYAQFHAPRRAGVAIYGAGSTGRQVAALLRSGSDHIPILFLDDDKNLKGSMISGLRVYPSDMLGVMIERAKIEVVLLAMPNLSRTKRQEILMRLEDLPVQVQTIPNIGDLVSGRASLDDIHEVPAEDLLGRDPVPPRPELMAANVTGKSVMVSGAGGSIGSELCRQLLALAPSQLVLLEQSEFNLYQIEQDLSELIARNSYSVTVQPVLGSVQHPERIKALLKSHAVQTVYHAAAYKHVPLVEDNIAEGVQNNVFGTLNLSQAAIEAGVSAFILVSTDKAVRPTNVMGATKRVAELICQAKAATQIKTRFSMVRFGNVLGSSGSVIPKFRQQIASGGPVTVTAPDITRYFMTIPEAAQLVIQAGAMAKGGDVFVLDMGEPIQILELAARMIRLSGRTPFVQDTGLQESFKILSDPNGDIEIIFTGLRPGEKLFEELLISGEVGETQHPRIMTSHETTMSDTKLETLLKDLWDAAQQHDNARLKEVLKAADVGYDPTPVS